MFFALEPDTKLRIYVGCFTARNDSKARVVEIPVGFCVLFRGDLIHNGMPYTTTNYRLRYYLSYAGMKWTPDIVQDALPQHGECQYCGEKVEKGQTLWKQRFYCEKKKTKGVENRLKRKREYKKGKYKCEVCDKVFKRQSSLRVHKMRGNFA
ncbi:hypothetical protein F441_22403 [Phytophthora nicotianae CJ01A1]|uniref:C2H2-type domain-containing protein n=1 Tax=Phytophthora nicotianae CJ01A1 TaxID=1317063 RepID=W2VPA1_PHYNI|nr:hypothetical protein F441_22403 [Phytophthora nicotianae CJ01A1]